MSLIERLFPIIRREANFFDPYRNYMENEFLAMEEQLESLQDHMNREMARIRNHMFQLLPYEREAQTSAQMIKPSYPIVEENGETKLKLDFNVQGFKPEEVSVKVLGNNVLQIEAKSETKKGSGESRRVFVRQYALPEGVQADKVEPVLSKDGVLTIKAPAPHLKPDEKIIPIKQAE